MSTGKSAHFLPDEKLEMVARCFKVLGEPMRLRILQSICSQPRTVGEIVEATGANQANISKHLALLASAGIVARQKSGQYVYYELKSQFVLKLCALVHQHLA